MLILEPKQLSVFLCVRAYVVCVCVCVCVACLGRSLARDLADA